MAFVHAYRPRQLGKYTYFTQHDFNSCKFYQYDNQEKFITIQIEVQSNIDGYIFERSIRAFCAPL